MTQFEIFAGINWSTKTHQVAVVNAGGVVLGERSFAHSGEGLAEMAGWIHGVFARKKCNLGIKINVLEQI